MELIKPDLSKPITKSDWLLVEEYYHKELGNISIPEDPKPYDITAINSKLEKLYHEARYDYLRISRAYENVESAYRKLKRALYPLVKTGKNAEEREHLLQEHLMATSIDKLEPAIIKSLGIPSSPVSIYVLYEGYKDRVDFMKATLDILSDKTGRLITDSGAMKIESRLGN
jgi:hypothetical protein